MAKITRNSKANYIIKIEEMNEEEDNTVIQNRILIEQCLQCDGSLICCSGCPNETFPPHCFHSDCLGAFLRVPSAYPLCPLCYRPLILLVGPTKSFIRYVDYDDIDFF